MKISTYIAAIFLAFGVTGCAIVVEVSTPCAGTASLNSSRVTQTNALEVFQKVSGSFGFNILEPPKKTTASGETCTVWTALPRRSSSLRGAYLIVYISEDRTIFQCRENLSASDVRKLASRIEQEFGERGICCHTTVFNESWFNN